MLLSFNSETLISNVESILQLFTFKCKTLRQICGNLHVVCVSGCASRLQANPCCISAVTDQTYPHRAKKHDLVINWLDVQNSPLSVVLFIYTHSSYIPRVTWAGFLAPLDVRYSSHTEEPLVVYIFTELETDVPLRAVIHYREMFYSCAGVNDFSCQTFPSRLWEVTTGSSFTVL